jgi:hypothetical protein
MSMSLSILIYAVESGVLVRCKYSNTATNIDGTEYIQKPIPGPFLPERDIARVKSIIQTSEISKIRHGRIVKHR